jgi:hypothetical protein
MTFLPTTTMGTEFLRLGSDDGPCGAVVDADGVSSLTGDRPDRRLVHFKLAVRRATSKWRVVPTEVLMPR